MNQIWLNAVRASARAVALWWRAGGAPEPVAAYQPIGAASLAASYVNLANPGVFDAAPQSTPVWSSAGWDMTTNWRLLTGITGIAVGFDGWSMLVRFSAASSAHSAFGVYNAAGNSFSIFPSLSSRVYYTINQDNFITPALTAGVLGIAGNTGYRNGSFDLALSGGGNPTGQIVIGARNDTTSQFWSGVWEAGAIWDTTLTAPQMAAVSAAMAAL